MKGLQGLTEDEMKVFRRLASSSTATTCCPISLPEELEKHILRLRHRDLVDAIEPFPFDDLKVYFITKQGRDAWVEWHRQVVLE